MSKAMRALPNSRVSVRSTTRVSTRTVFTTTILIGRATTISWLTKKKKFKKMRMSVRTRRAKIRSTKMRRQGTRTETSARTMTRKNRATIKTNQASNKRSTLSKKERREER